MNGWTATGDGSYTQTRPANTRIRALDDDEHEADETFRIILQNTPGVSQAIVPDLTPVIATIIDDDALDVTGVSVTSTPDMGVYYVAGETISFTVAINGAVTVTGTPQFTFELGGQTRQAAYTSGSDTKELVFTYTVVSGDDDHDGISWSDDALDLNGGDDQVHAHGPRRADRGTTGARRAGSPGQPQGGHDDADPGIGQPEPDHDDDDLQRGAEPRRGRQPRPTR